VRAKVCLFQRQQGKAGALAEAKRLGDMTVRHLRASTVKMIMVGGPPASGKSTLAAALADRFGLTLLSSDRVRKELAGLAPEEPAASAYQTGIYRPEWTDRTYGELIARAESLVRAGESVVIDATWSSGAHRAAANEVARDCSADLVSLLCAVPSDVAAQRLVSRPRGPSDADASISEAILATFDPWPEAVTVATSGPLATAVGRAMTAIHPEDPGGQGRIFRRPYMEPG
jgi:predicted kinase